MDADVIAVMSAQVEGLTIDTPEDAVQTAIEWVPLCVLDRKMASVLAQLIRYGKVRIDPTWSDDGRILELSIVRIHEAL